MDGNQRTSQNHINVLFKHVTSEEDAFKKRMGNVRSFKKQILPNFLGSAPAPDKSGYKATKDAKKAKA